MGEKKVVLPPGFEFDPTDQELILHFLFPKAANLPCYPYNIIPHLDVYALNPWDLNGKAFRSKKEWYLFSGCRRKGFWKETGVSGPILSSNGHEIGIKCYLVFQDTNWLMEEYHLLNNININASTSASHQMGANQISDLKELVLCRVHEANCSSFFDESNYDDDSGVELSYLDEAFYLEDDEDQQEISYPN